jgi:hypothetical protein
MTAPRIAKSRPGKGGFKRFGRFQKPTMQMPNHHEGQSHHNERHGNAPPESQ